jgi:hypothetical protein
MNQVAFVLLAVALTPVGLWARRNAATLVGPYLEPRARAKRSRVIRRGGSVCLVVAAGFAVFAVVDLW